LRIMKSSQTKKIIAFNGSPLKDSNTDLITSEILKGAADCGFEPEHVYLNDMKILPCQSCGESPGNALCLFEDQLFPFLHSYAGCDITVISSPVYFDTVSAQTKLFIDRCNCFRPLEGYKTGDFEFRKLDLKPRLGIIVLVGGEREKFANALTVIKGFFLWTGVEFFDKLFYAHEDYALGTVRKNSQILGQARQIGQSAAKTVKNN